MATETFALWLTFERRAGQLYAVDVRLASEVDREGPWDVIACRR